MCVYVFCFFKAEIWILLVSRANKKTKVKRKLIRDRNNKY